jgi:hypothetical protein
VLVLWGGVAQTVRAGAIDPSEDFNNFGKQGNCRISGGGICAAAAAINSFIFLENQYPQIYGNKLTPNVVGAAPNQTDPTDRNAFGVLYYFGTGNPLDRYLADKKLWINSAAPGTTVFNSYYVGSADNNRTPTAGDLIKEMQSQEDVEMFVSGGGIAHAITLTGISCQPLTGCVMTYQDPNSPMVQQTSQLTAGAGSLQFVGLPGTGAPYLTTQFTIYAAYSESPVPEPSSFILLGTGIASLIGNWMRRKARFRRSRS